TGPVSGIEPPPLKWEHLVRQDHHDKVNPSLGSAVLAITSHKEPKTAQFPTRDEVSRIEVTRARRGSLPGAPEPPPLAVIKDEVKIDAILNILHKNSDDWEPVPFTPPAGIVYVSLQNGAEFKGVVRLGGYGSLQGPLSADRPGEYFKDISADDLWQLAQL